MDRFQQFMLFEQFPMLGGIEELMHHFKLSIGSLKEDHYVLEFIQSALVDDVPQNRV